MKQSVDMDVKKNEIVEFVHSLEKLQRTELYCTSTVLLPKNITTILDLAVHVNLVFLWFRIPQELLRKSVKLDYLCHLAFL